MRRVLAFVLAALLLLSSGGAWADVPVPALSAPVTDLTATLKPQEIAALNTRLLAYEKEKGTQIAVLLVPTTAPETIEQYSLRVAEQWKLGRKGVDDGVLFLIAMKDRALRIEVGYGLEGALPDISAKRIIEDIVKPHFKSGDYARGVSAGVGAIITALAGEPLPVPTSKAGEAVVSSNFIHLLLFVAVISFVSLQRVVGRVGAAGVSSLLVGLITFLSIGLMMAILFTLAAFFIMLFFDFLPVGRMARMGGGQGLGGGFSGGGGRFGGGGASGRW